MKNTISKFVVAIKGLMQEEGQDLVEYALVLALIACVATAGMKTVATAISTTFTNIGATLTAA